MWWHQKKVCYNFWYVKIHFLKASELCELYFFFRWYWKTPEWCRFICNCANNYFLFNPVAWNIVNITSEVLQFLLRTFSKFKPWFKIQIRNIKVFWFFVCVPLRWPKKKRTVFRKPNSIVLAQPKPHGRNLFFCVYTVMK